MRYYKLTEDGYFTFVGIGTGGVEITKDEYDAVLTAIKNKPTKTEHTDYRLKENLTWEMYEIQPQPDPPEPEPDIEPEEALSILLGGAI